MRVAAIHEAAHAIARIRFGLDLDAVSIEPSADAGGLTSGGSDDEDIEKRVVVLYAGYMAETRLAGVSAKQAARHAASDLEA